MNTATRCAYTARSLSPARASHTRQLPGGASCDPGLFFSLGARHSGPGAAAGLNPPSPSASRRNSNPGDVALIRSPAGCRVDRMMGSGAHLSGVSSLP